MLDRTANTATPTACNFAFASYLMLFPAWVILRFYYLGVAGTESEPVASTYLTAAVALQLAHAAISIVVAGLGYTARRNGAGAIAAACFAFVAGIGFFFYASYAISVADYQHHGSVLR
jgi:hypothetical protein